MNNLLPFPSLDPVQIPSSCPLSKKKIRYANSYCGLWVIAPCSLIERYSCFGDICCFLAFVSPKYLYPPVRLQNGSLTHNTMMAPSTPTGPPILQGLRSKQLSFCSYGFIGNGSGERGTPYSVIESSHYFFSSLSHPPHTESLYRYV